MKYFSLQNNEPIGLFVTPGFATVNEQGIETVYM